MEPTKCNWVSKEFDGILKRLLEKTNIWYLTYGHNKKLCEFLIMMGIPHETSSTGQWIKTLGNKSNRTLSQQDNEESEPMGEDQQA